MKREQECTAVGANDGSRTRKQNWLTSPFSIKRCFRRIRHGRFSQGMTEAHIDNSRLKVLKDKESTPETQVMRMIHTAQNDGQMRKTNGTAFQFLDLPRELRDKVGII